METTKIKAVVDKLLATSSLPAAAIAEKLDTELHNHHGAVIVAPPGAGKSTLLPLAMLHTLSEGRIVMLEPRRLAARQVAMRMARLLGEEVGHTVGYQIRFERKVTAETRIEVVTEGILARRLAADATLDGVSCLIFDEFHERSISSDLAFCLARKVREVLRPELNIVAMSATIDTGELCQSLGVHEVSCQGRMFPVDIILSKDDTQPSEIAADVAAAVCRAHREHDGDILAFLPGQAEIERCADILGDSLAPTRVCSLYGNLSMDKQNAAIAPSTDGRRRIVLATPIAETSLTIEGVRVVVDSGYCRRLVYDATSGLSHLETMRISLDMARQRSGRAGRVAPGVCYRLWTLATEQRMAAQRQPEIEDADLMPMVLSVAAFGETDIMGLPWLTPPPMGNLRRAIDSLRQLRAIDKDGRITSVGRRMESLPCHPRIARMMIAAGDHTRKALACDIAAIMEEKDVMNTDEVHADMLPRVTALRDARRSHHIGRWGRIAKVAGEYARMIGVETEDTYVSGQDIGALIAVAWPERIAKALDHNGNYRLASGEKVKVEPEDALAGYEWLAVATLHAGNRNTGKIFLAAPVEKEAVMSLATWKDNLTWMTRQGGLVSQKELRIGVLTLETRHLDDVDRDSVVSVVCDAVSREGLSLLDWNENVKMLQRRVEMVRQWHPEMDLPCLDTEYLLKTVTDWLPFYLDSGGHMVTSVEGLHKIPLVTVLWNLLPYESQQAVDRLAPERIRVPSGSMIRLSYRIGAEEPVLSVRLQECFGMADTPRIDDGRVPVLMELLSPGFKPVQLTKDLASFWDSTYFEVRKELRRRYPKHYWPDNPLESEATRGVRRRQPSSRR